MPPIPYPTIDQIYEWYERQPRERRDYLGISKLGEECRRMLWYSFRWAWEPEIEGRILRLFETGHREEERILDNLRAIGCTIEGDQFEVSALGGYLRGHFDCVILGLPESPKTWHLGEIKTMNRKNFDKLEREGLAKSKPVYHAQMTVYMHLGELTRGAFIAQCKDDDRLYLERIEADKGAAEALIRKGASIIGSETVPSRISNDPSFYKCKWCDYQSICHRPVYPEVNCRTCAHWLPGDSQPGECAHGHSIGEGNACGQHLYIPSLLHWLEPIDGSPDFVEYVEYINASEIGAPAGTLKPIRTSFELYGLTKTDGDLPF